MTPPSVDCVTPARGAGGAADSSVRTRSRYGRLEDTIAIVDGLEVRVDIFVPCSLRSNRSADSEVSAKSAANDVGRGGVVSGGAVLERLSQFGFETHGHCLCRARSHRRAPWSTPQLGNVQPCFCLACHAFENLVSQLDA